MENPDPAIFIPLAMVLSIIAIVLLVRDTIRYQKTIKKTQSDARLERINRHHQSLFDQDAMTEKDDVK